MLNADAIVGSTGELLGHNMYAYCKNNAVNMSDPSGFRPLYTHTIAEETVEMRKASLATMRTATTVSRKKKSIKDTIKSAARSAKSLLNNTRINLVKRVVLLL